MRNEIKEVINNPQIVKSLGREFTAKFCQTFKELILMLFKLFHKITKGRNASKLILSSQYYPDTKT
jgi:hypothetical protein